MKIYHTRFNNFLEVNDPGEQIEIFVKSTSKIFLEFAIRKPLTDDPEFTLDTSIIPIPHSLNPLPMPLKIFFIDKPIHSRLTSFSFILQHQETGEFCYHYASNNNQILNSPRLIRNQKDLENLLDHLAAKDFPSHLKDQRPNTKWIIERIVSLRIHLVMTTYPLGNPPKLPDYIKNNRFIIGLEKDQNHDNSGWRIFGN